MEWEGKGKTEAEEGKLVLYLTIYLLEVEFWMHILRILLSE